MRNSRLNKRTVKQQKKMVSQYGPRAKEKNKNSWCGGGRKEKMERK